MRERAAKKLWLANVTLLVVAAPWAIVASFIFWVTIISLILLPVTTFLAIWFWLAPNNYFFTFVKEGTAKIVVRGDGFEKALLQWAGYTLNPNTWDVVPEGEPQPPAAQPPAAQPPAGWRGWIANRRDALRGWVSRMLHAPIKEPWHPFGGLRLYGIWPIFDIYSYWFKWSGVTEDGKIVHHEKEFLDYILVKHDTYFGEVEDAEDKNLLPLHIKLVFTIRIINPHKALFKVQNWLELTLNRTKPAVRDIATQDVYEEWIKKPEAMGDLIYRRANDMPPDGRGLFPLFRDEYGVDVMAAQVMKVDPPEGYREKTLAPYFADLERRAVVIRADAESQRIDKVFNKIKEFEDLGRLVRSLEALEKSPEQGAKWVIPLPGGAEFLREIFGGRPVEAVTRQEFAELRAMVERVIQGKGGQTT